MSIFLFFVLLYLHQLHLGRNQALIMEEKLLIYKCCSYSSLFMIGVGLGRLEFLTNNPHLNCCFQGISSL